MNGLATHTTGVVGTFSAGIRGSREVQAMLGARALRYAPSAAAARELDSVVGWGCKPNTHSAQAYARRHGLPYLRLEDGFLRSVGLGVEGAQALSLVVDDQGIY
jgi:capsular polysaccharide export protein